MLVLFASYRQHREILSTTTDLAAMAMRLLIAWAGVR